MTMTPLVLSAASASALWQRRRSTIYRESLCRDAVVTNTKMQQSSPLAAVTHEQVYSMSEVPLNHNTSHCSPCCLAPVDIDQYLYLLILS